MKINAYGRTLRTWSGECFRIEGAWSGVDRGSSRAVGRVVIDLGNKDDGIGARAVAPGVDVIVLTHDDDDHIGDAPNVLRTLGVDRNRQVWVPADWWYVVAAWGASTGSPACPEGPIAVTAEDIERVARHSPKKTTSVVTRDHPRLPGLERGFCSPDGHIEHHDAIAAWLTSIEDDLPDDAEDKIAVAVVEHRTRTGRSGGRQFTGTPQEVARRVMRRADIIRATMTAAARTSELRFFTVDTYAQTPDPWLTEGIPQAVTLVNAQEVIPPRACIVDPLAVLTHAVFLSAQNRRALVTFVWPDLSGANGFLCWSDSGGYNCGLRSRAPTSRTPWDKVGIMSAPHHGSRDKAHNLIWRVRLARRPSTPVLLCNNSQDTRPEYTSLPRRLRAATQHDKSCTYRLPFYVYPRIARARWASGRWVVRGVQ
ncbi:hypothetical protein GB931_16635 [Modestobacter sp. I12A-02628]|uniref:Metallo-beta-lactamase domain-containing protein n=1 Tax=Goekera deserti TaxID=2497753 RepID=A0A7K3WEU7_9ACTN|nr:hypothetical protein [Goekera deserti]MPQ99512.1 hypothetical protein [Goekera deserti]NDI48999.1 hypothetical protein [Goekera deserti]NEL54210.1 hypothetical protein [Goekera deserti]